MTVKSYYECHVTFTSDQKYLEQAKGLAALIGWKFSKIDGDPVLGEGVKCYLTTHYNARKSVDRIKRMLNAAHNDLENHGFKVLRKKIELVIHDEIIKNAK